MESLLKENVYDKLETGYFMTMIQNIRKKDVSFINDRIMDRTYHSKFRK